MLVCQCRGITDRQIRRLVRDGAGSAREIARATGAGRDCGGCRSNVKKVVELAVAQTTAHELNAGRSTALRGDAAVVALPVEG